MKTRGKYKKKSRMKTFQTFWMMLGQPQFPSAPAQRQKVPLNNIYVSVSEKQSFPALCLAAAAALRPLHSWTSVRKPHLFFACPRVLPPPLPPSLYKCGGRGWWGAQILAHSFQFFLSSQFKWTFFFPCIQAGHHLEAVIYVMVVLTPLRNRLLSWFIDSFFPLLIWLIS